MNSPEDDDTFEQLQREFFGACELPGDKEAIDRLYSADFFSINADGSTSDKQEVLEIFDAGRFPVSETITFDETQVRRYGDTAIVTGRSKWANPDPDLTTIVRHTQIWDKQDGQWRLVGWQGTPVEEEKGLGPGADLD